MKTTKAISTVKKISKENLKNIKGGFRRFTPDVYVAEQTEGVQTI